MTVVWFRSVPLRTFLDLLVTVDALQREVQIIGLDEDGPPSPPGEEVEPGQAAFDEARATLYDQAIEAHEAGAEVTDLAASQHDEAWEAMLDVARALLGADEEAAAGELLTLPLPPPERELYEWMAEEVMRQLAGAAPRTFLPPT